MNLIFMGTPDIAAESLDTLLKCGHNISCVFTREDKPVGRKQILTAPPVKELAITHNIPVLQPKSLRNNEIIEKIAALNPDLIVVVAYGRILPKEILDTPRYGCINLHVSLLPMYRGAAPIQWSIINGDSKTGVTIQYMSEGIDEGDIITVAPVDIGINETSKELFEKVSKLGAQTLCDTIEDIKCGKAQRIAQDASKATFAPMLNKEIANIDFNMSYIKLHNLIRGLNPWPIARFIYDNKQIKILKTRCTDESADKCGTVISINPLTIACKDGAVILDEVIPQGSKLMSGAQWAAGKRLAVGQIL